MYKDLKNKYLEQKKINKNLADIQKEETKNMEIMQQKYNELIKAQMQAKEELKQKDKLIQDLEIEVKYSKIKRPEDRFKTISDMAKEEDVPEESVEMIPLDKIVKAIDEVLDNYK